MVKFSMETANWVDIKTICLYQKHLPHFSHLTTFREKHWIPDTRSSLMEIHDSSSRGIEWHEISSLSFPGKIVLWEVNVCGVTFTWKNGSKSCTTCLWWQLCDFVLVGITYQLLSNRYLSLKFYPPFRFWYKCVKMESFLFCINF